jgi:mono/diheme cytochrome c family protein
MSAKQKKTAVFMAAGLALLVMLLGVTGCRRNEGSAGSLPRSQGNSAAAHGRTVFDANRCGTCHTIGGQGGGQGPDLTHIGAKPENTYEALMQKVKNHPALSPTSGLPAFQLSPVDVVSLAGYLASLK